MSCHVSGYLRGTSSNPLSCNSKVTVQTEFAYMKIKNIAYISRLYSKFYIISQHELINIAIEFTVVEENLRNRNHKTQLKETEHKNLSHYFVTITIRLTIIIIVITIK